MENRENFLARVRDCDREEKLFSYLKEDAPGVALEIAKSPHATARILESLARHSSIIIRHEVAKNSQSSAFTLTRLSEDKDMLVRDYARRTLACL